MAVACKFLFVFLSLLVACASAATLRLFGTPTCSGAPMAQSDFDLNTCASESQDGSTVHYRATCQGSNVTLSMYSDAACASTPNTIRMTERTCTQLSGSTYAYFSCTTINAAISLRVGAFAAATTVAAAIILTIM